MRVVPALLFLAGVSAFAQIGRYEAPATGAAMRTGWILGVQKLQPTFTATVEGSKDGQVTVVNTESDLGLGRASGPLGFMAEYQGQVHAFFFSYGPERYEGNQVLPRDIMLNGTPYAAGTSLQSTGRIDVLEGLWTYKFVRQADAWVGFDLGAQYFKTEFTAFVSTSTQPQKASLNRLAPQIGITGYSSGADGLLDSRLFFRYFRYKGATITRYGLDARAYLYPSFGLRGFYEENRIHIPTGSIQQDLDSHSDRRLIGMGLIVRF